MENEVKEEKGDFIKEWKRLPIAKREMCECLQYRRSVELEKLVIRWSNYKICL